MSNSSYCSSPEQQQNLMRLTKVSHEAEPSSITPSKTLFSEIDPERKKQVIKISISNSRNLSASNQIFELSSRDSDDHTKKAATLFEVDVGSKKISKTDDIRSVNNRANRLMISGKKWDNEQLSELQGKEFLTCEAPYSLKTQTHKTYLKDDRRGTFDITENSSERESFRLRNFMKIDKEFLKNSPKAEIIHSYYEADNIKQKSSCIVYDSEKEEAYSLVANYEESPKICNSKVQVNNKRENRWKKKAKLESSIHTANFRSSSEKILKGESKLQKCSNETIIPSNDSTDHGYKDPLSLQISFKRIHSRATPERDSSKIRRESNSGHDVEKIDIVPQGSLASKQNSKHIEDCMKKSIKFRINYEASRYNFEGNLDESSSEEQDESTYANMVESRDKTSNIFESMVPSSKSNSIKIKEAQIEKKQLSKKSPFLRPSSAELIKPVGSIPVTQLQKIGNRRAEKSGFKYIRTRESPNMVKYGSKVIDLVSRGYSATPPFKINMMSHSGEKSFEEENRGIETKRIVISREKTKYIYQSTKKESDKENCKRVENIAKNHGPISKRVIYFNSKKKERVKRSSIDSRDYRLGSTVSNAGYPWLKSSIDTLDSGRSYGRRFVRNISNIKESQKMRQIGVNSVEMYSTGSKDNFSVEKGSVEMRRAVRICNGGSVESKRYRNRNNSIDSKRVFRDYRNGSVESKDLSRYKEQRALPSSRRGSLDKSPFVETNVSSITGSQTARVYRESIKTPQIFSRRVTTANYTPNKISFRVTNGSVHSISRRKPCIIRKGSLDSYRGATPVRSIRLKSTKIDARKSSTARSNNGLQPYPLVTSKTPKTPISISRFNKVIRNVTPIRSGIKERKSQIKTVRKNSNLKDGGNNSRATNFYTKVVRNSIESRSNRQSLANNENLARRRVVTPIRTHKNVPISTIQSKYNSKDRPLIAQKLTFTPQNFDSKISNRKVLTPMALNLNQPQQKNLRTVTPPKNFQLTLHNVETVKRSPARSSIDPSNPFTNTLTTSQLSETMSNTNPLMNYMGRISFHTDKSHPIGNVFRTPHSSFCETQTSFGASTKPNPPQPDNSSAVSNRILDRIKNLLERYDVRNSGYIQVKSISQLVRDIYGWLGVEDAVSINRDINDYVRGISCIEKFKGRKEVDWKMYGFKKRNVEEYLFKRLNYAGNGLSS